MNTAIMIHEVQGGEIWSERNMRMYADNGSHLTTIRVALVDLDVPHIDCRNTGYKQILFDKAVYKGSTLKREKVIARAKTFAETYASNNGMHVVNNMN